MTQHLIRDVDGKKRMVSTEELQHPLPPEKSQDQRAREIAEARVADVADVAEALGLNITPAQIRANLIAMERRKRGLD